MFAAALSQPLDASLKEPMEMSKTTNGFARGAKYIRLLAAHAKDDAASNKSMNVRAKQRLSYQTFS